jgi:type III secretory pathway component EscT
MTHDSILGKVNEALMIILIVSSPVLIAAVVIGLLVGLLQALTQIQDQTLPQAVKLVVVLVLMILLGPGVVAAGCEPGIWNLRRFSHHDALSRCRNVGMELIGDPFKPLEPYIFAAAFALARMLAMMVVFPVFDRLGVTGFVRNSIAVVISIPLIPMIAAHLEGEQLSLGLIAALILKEVIVGLIVGLVLAVPLYAAEAAGDILDLQRGSSSASLSDPLGTSQAAYHGHAARA